MRNITRAGHGHNRRAAPPVALLIIPLLLTALAAGCGGDQRRAAAPSSRGSPVKIDVAALDAWLAILDRLERGEAVPAEAYQQLFDQPAYALLHLDPRSLSPGILRNCTEYVHLRAAGDEALATAPKRADIVANCDYLRKHAEEARNFASVLADDQYRSQVWELARRWINPMSLPGSLTVHAMVGSTSIGFQKPDHVILDAGLALAAGREQAARMTVSRLYAELMAPPGPLPRAAASGREALQQCLRLIHHHAVIAWIAGGIELEFDADHDHLGIPRLQYRTPQERAAELLDRMVVMLEGMLDPGHEDLLEQYGKTIDDLLFLRGQYEILGFAMAEVIAARGGEAALLEMSGDTAAFLDAYQSARGPESAMPAFPPRLLDQLTSLAREP